MKYNKSYEGIDFEDYEKYLTTIKGNLHPKLFDFISDPDRHNFSEKSLHDSKIKRLTCDTDLENGETNITIILLGENREFYLSFSGVTQYKISQINSDMYNDLITFEVGFEKDIFDNDVLVFRALFACEKGEIEVYAESIDIDEKLSDDV